LAFQLGESEPKVSKLDQFVGANGKCPIVGDSPVFAELGRDTFEVFEPGTLFELKTESGDLLLEHAGAMDIVGNDRPALSRDENQDGTGFRQERLTEISARREPGHGIGPPKHDGVVMIRLEEFSQPPMLFFNIRTPSGQNRVAVIGGGIGKSGKRVLQRPVAGGLLDRLIRLYGWNRDSFGDVKVSQPVEMNLG
jgi:hypothetical protein